MQALRLQRMNLATNSLQPGGPAQLPASMTNQVGTGRVAPGMSAGPGKPAATGTTAQVAAAAKPATNTISRIMITCRMVDRHKISASANTDLAFAVRSNIMLSPCFTTNVDLGTNGVVPDPTDPNTFTFDLTVGLKNPYKL
jgi:hypothetical protein